MRGVRTARSPEHRDRLVRRDQSLHPDPIAGHHGEILPPSFQHGASPFQRVVERIDEHVVIGHQVGERTGVVSVDARDESRHDFRRRHDPGCGASSVLCHHSRKTRHRPDPSSSAVRTPSISISRPVAARSKRVCHLAIPVRSEIARIWKLNLTFRCREVAPCQADSISPGPRFGSPNVVQ